MPPCERLFGSEISLRTVRRQDARPWGSRGSLEAPTSAIERRTFVHGPVQVERECSKLCSLGAEGRRNALRGDGCGESEISMRVVQRQDA